MPTKKETDSYKTDLYIDAIAEGIETLLLDYDYVLSPDWKLAEQLTLRGRPCTKLTVGKVRRERGIPHYYQRLRQHRKDAEEWAANQELEQ